jgi:GNAT superfamily N-acetyltransferase
MAVDRVDTWRYDMLTIRQAESEQDVAHVRELFWEYLQWANARLNEEYDINLPIATMIEHDMETLDIFLPPQGYLLLALEGSQAAGLACMKTIRDDIVEVKRMYVRPAFRRRGLGRQLLEALIHEARASGYPIMRLDSTRFMAEAHALYRSAGFEEIEEYPESEIPPQFRQHWVFMERRLQDVPETDVSA